MKTFPSISPVRRTLPLLIVVGAMALPLHAATLHVWQESPSPSLPYDSWATAAHVLQEAVDAALDGDTVLVTNGVYATGGRAVAGTMTNRAAIDRAIIVQSVNGPEGTVIEGAEAPAGDESGNGDGAIRSVYLGTNAVLSGFTLTNGHTRTGGNVATEQRGGGVWCETSSVVTNCTLTGNAADSGGGAHGGTLYNCTLTGNAANSAGGAQGGTLYNCTLTGNAANSAGGAQFGTLYNCTLIGNSASYVGGGAYRGTLYNCIVYRNSALEGPNYSGSSFQYSCATPLPAGEGNIDADPRLASASHLSLGSPCIGMGSSEFAQGVDMDGELWGNPPCMGADQLTPGSATGELTMHIGATYTRFGAGYAAPFVANNTGPITASVWDFGDGTVVTNQPWISHAWNADGTYEVRLTGYNDSNPNGVSTTLTIEVVEEEVYYVDAASATPAFPYNDWQTAATTIQEAIGAGSLAGRLVLVTNGVYAQGGVAIQDTMTNRIALTNAVRVQSVNGPDLTVIQGAEAPGGGYGDGAIRCAYVGEAAILSGFTLTNGYATGGGGVKCEGAGVVTNCTLTGNAAGAGGGAYGGTLNNCTLTRNLAASGGGAYGGVLYNSTLTSNTATLRGGGVKSCTLFHCHLTGNAATDSHYGSHYGGGGAYQATLYSCTLVGNTAEQFGGGAQECQLHDCILTANAASWGGGARESDLFNCTLTGNWARFGKGGGVCSGTLYNCVLTANSAWDAGGGIVGGTSYNCTLTGNWAWDGGGSSGGTLYNCTVTGNSARESGGGTFGSTLYNCIVYHNSAPTGSNYNGGSLQYSCTTPLAPGEGNIDADPQLASVNHLSLISPCIGAGSSDLVQGVDIDGEPWGDPPCIGPDQLTPGSATGELTMSASASFARVMPAFPVDFVAHNTGPLTASVWDFGDGTRVTNQAYTSHAWATTGVYEVRLTGFNDTFPDGISGNLTICVDEGISYVNQANPTPALPYDDWDNAATTIQDAISASPPGGLVLVTNGVYAVGQTNVIILATATGLSRVGLVNGVRVKSVNGPEVTLIEGAEAPGGANGPGAIRCAFVSDGSVLDGFTLTNGHTESGTVWPWHQGGGVSCNRAGVVTNCIITRNSAGQFGGGAEGGTLYNCTLTGNSSDLFGGGAAHGTLYNCTLIGNSAGRDGGGASLGTLNNCTLTGNSAVETGGGAASGTLYNCTLIGNSAGEGGGAVHATLYSCLLTGNSAVEKGGGAAHGTLYNCTVIGNSAGEGGGAHGISTSPCALHNCIVYANTAPSSPNYNTYCNLSHCCASPLPPGEGNISSAPAFVNQAAGDFHLLPASPCIDAGTNLSALVSTDLDGVPRPLDSNGDGVTAFDIGAYEVLLPTADSNGDGIPDGWTHQHGFDPSDPNVGAGNPDNDQFSTFEEWQADTDPNDGQSYFFIDHIEVGEAGSPVTVHFQSSSNRVYTLRSADDLSEGTWSDQQVDVPGSGGMDTLSDTNAAARRFYRVQVRVP